jgi:hypothetical protein
LSLDKWLKPENGEKKPEKKKDTLNRDKKRETEGKEKKGDKKSSTLLKKYLLVCPNLKCKYQKTIIKKILTDRDIVCPRCTKKLKVRDL